MTTDLVASVPRSDPFVQPDAPSLYPCPGPDADGDPHLVRSLVTEGRWPPYRCPEHQPPAIPTRGPLAAVRVAFNGHHPGDDQPRVDSPPVLRRCVACGELRTHGLTFLLIDGQPVAQVCRQPMDQKL